MYEGDRDIIVPGVGTYNIYPIGDLQYGAPGFDKELFLRWREKVLADPMPILIGMGDYSDHFRYTVQNKLSQTFSDDKPTKLTIDKWYDDFLDEIKELFEPIKKKKTAIWLGLLTGHHFYTYETGVTSDQKLCMWLNCAHLQEMVLMRLRFKQKSSPQAHTWSIDIHAQHGDGGAAFVGPDINNLERRTMPYVTADLILRGHSSKKWALPLGTRRRLTDIRPVRGVETPIFGANTGCFMNGYVPGQTTYVSRKNMPPAALGWVVIHVTLLRHRSNEKGRPAYDFEITGTC